MSTEENWSKYRFKNKRLQKANLYIFRAINMLKRRGGGGGGVAGDRAGSWFWVSKQNYRGWAYFFIDFPMILPAGGKQILLNWLTWTGITRIFRYFNLQIFPEALSMNGYDFSISWLKITHISTTWPKAPMNSVTFAMNWCSVTSVFLPTFKNWLSEGLVGRRVPGCTHAARGQEPNPEAGRRAGSLDSTSALSATTEKNRLTGWTYPPPSPFLVF